MELLVFCGLLCYQSPHHTTAWGGRARQVIAIGSGEPCTSREWVDTWPPHCLVVRSAIPRADMTGLMTQLTLVGVQIGDNHQYHNA